MSALWRLGLNLPGSELPSTLYCKHSSIQALILWLMEGWDSNSLGAWDVERGLDLMALRVLGFRIEGFGHPGSRVDECIRRLASEQYIARSFPYSRVLSKSMSNLQAYHTQEHHTRNIRWHLTAKMFYRFTKRCSMTYPQTLCELVIPRVESSRNRQPTDYDK